VAERAIGVNEAVDPRLERALRRGAARSGVGASAARHSAAAFPQLETLEEGGPARVQRLGILLPAAVIFLENVEIQMSRK
jgi:hypothetical protein